ncbi:hypothetical protein PORY_002433, partial [Pneumocystis oryctolagi]
SIDMHSLDRSQNTSISNVSDTSNKPFTSEQIKRMVSTFLTFLQEVNKLNAERILMERQKKLKSKIKNIDFENLEKAHCLKETKNRDGLSFSGILQDYIEYDLSKIKDYKGGYIVDKDSSNKVQNSKLNKVIEQNTAFDPLLAISLDPSDNIKCKECGGVELDFQFLKIFNTRVCYKCKKKFPDKYSLLTKTECKNDYLLTDSELHDKDILPCMEKPNPQKPGWGVMMLFLRCQVEEFAWKKWGGPENLDMEWERRVKERKVRKVMRLQKKIEDLRKRTRTTQYIEKIKNKQEKHVHDFSLPTINSMGLMTRKCFCGFENDLGSMIIDDNTLTQNNVSYKIKEIQTLDTKQNDNILPWVEKYRPEDLKEIVSHQDIILTIEEFIKKNRVPHLLFYGPPGTGKTSTILACAKKIYGSKFRNYLLELNASDERGIDVVREQIKNFASTKQIFNSKFKLVILDEADAMTLAAQNALRRVIEKYTKNVRFCIICNYVNKISLAIQSRCTKFRFQPLLPKEIYFKLDYVIEKENVNINEKGKEALHVMLLKLDYVIEKENVNINEKGKEALVKLSHGDMRKGLNILQACHAAYDSIDENSVYNCVGNPRPETIELIVKSLLNDDFLTCLNIITKMKTEKGLALLNIITGVHETLDELELPVNLQCYILDNLATIEYRLSNGASEKIQLSAMIGSIKTGIDLAEKKRNTL